MKKVMAGSMVLTTLVLQASNPGYAHERHYAWTEEYQTLPQGEFELEGWTTLKVPNSHATNVNTIQYQGELEYGVTDHLTVAHYERWRTRNQAGSDSSGAKRKDATTYQDFKFETKYRIGEKGTYWLDPLIYLEWISDPRQGKTSNTNTLEGKLVLSKDIGKYNIAYNQIMESGLGHKGRTEHRFTAALRRELFGGLSAGFEARGDYWKPSSRRNRLAMGPTLSYSHAYFWVVLGASFGANRAADDREVRVIVGIPIG